MNLSKVLNIRLLTTWPVRLLPSYIKKYFIRAGFRVMTIGSAESTMDSTTETKLIAKYRKKPAF